MSAREALAVAEVVAPHGVHGWVRVRLHDPTSTALRAGLRATLRAERLPDLAVEILAAEPVPGKPALRVRLAGVDDRDQAEALRGREVWLDRADLPPLREDEFYLADLLGLAVERTRADGTTQPLGTVVALTSNGAQDLLEVQWRGRETWLLPVLPQFLADVDARRVLVDLPLGMLPDELEEPGA